MNCCTISNQATTIVTAVLWWLFWNLNKRFFFPLKCMHAQTPGSIYCFSNLFFPRQTPHESCFYTAERRLLSLKGLKQGSEFLPDGQKPTCPSELWVNTWEVSWYFWPYLNCTFKECYVWDVLSKNPQRNSSNIYSSIFYYAS